MKKFVSLILAAALSVTATVSAWAAPAEGEILFTDIGGTSYQWAYSYIQDMVKRGYIKGYEDNTFRPDNSVTRLEVLALFARALGAQDEINKPILEMANEMYGQTVQKYGLSWGTDEIAFLLYRGVLKESDLDTYLKEKLKDEPMPRYESAIIITKAMGGESEATKDPGVVLDYTDQKDIPTSALQYVAYVSENGIMQGMDDGSFAPRDSVRRSEMAVMLSRVVDKVNYTFQQLKISEVDTIGRIITAKDADGETVRMTYLDNVMMRVNGETVQPKEMEIGVNAIFTLSNQKVAFIDTFATVADESFEAIYQSSSSSTNGVVVVLTVDGKRKSYPCSDTMSVIFDGSPASLASFKQGAKVQVELVNNEIEKITGETKDVTINNATIESYTLTPEFTITIAHGDEKYNGKTYAVADDVRILKNDASVDFSQIYTGDKVSLTLEYGVVTIIKASSSKRTVEGAIRSISKSLYERSKMVISVNGEDMEFEIPDDITVTINGADGTIDDLSLGDTVKVTLESQAITSIVKTASAGNSNGPVTGTITSVVTANRFIVIEYETSSGTMTSIPAVVKDSTTIMTTKGLTKKITDLKPGHVVSVYGETGSNGAFTANMIIIDEAASNVSSDK